MDGGRGRVDGGSVDLRNLNMVKSRKGKEDFRINKVNYSFSIDGVRAGDTEDSLEKTGGERVGRRARGEEGGRQIRDEVKTKDGSEGEIGDKVSGNLVGRVEGAVVREKPNLKEEVVVKSGNVNIRYLGQKNGSRDRGLGLAGKKIGFDDLMLSGCSKMGNKLPIQISVSSGKDGKSRFNKFNNNNLNQNKLKLEILK